MSKSINNLKDFNKWIDKIGELAEKEAQEMVKKYTEAIADEAKNRAPVDTGALKQSIGTFYSSNGLTGYAYTNMDYAIYQEYGTRYIPAREYFKRSYDKYFDDIIKELESKGLKKKG